EACNNYAVMLATGQGVKVDITGAAELYIKSCELGDANACYNAGSILINFSDTLRNFFEVVKLFEKACELGSSEGCYNAANVYVGGINVNIDMDKSAYYFRRSCELSNNNMQACLNAGVIDYDKNIEKSIAYFKKSCDKNNYLGCYNLGIAKIKIATTKGELKEAKSILELACKKNEELACSASKDIQSVINLLP
ncbi:MAG: sel1 repeat family protein, partial [Campylobacteraceae bacterium]|nr:sel1 repeat family protein [Campylobacteraceae bacterium]